MQFRQHKVNLLVGTSVLESNIDLPKCNLVAMFDPPQSYTSYIKTKVCYITVTMQFITFGMVKKYLLGPDFVYALPNS